MATRLGKYRLVKHIAKGGMAEVFLAKQQGPAGFEQEVVVKRILPERAQDPRFVAMFLSEARVAASMSHPNIVQIVELGEHEGTYFIAMEAVRGISLGQLIERMSSFGLRVPQPFAARIVSDICAGLGYAHGFHAGPETRGVLHGDVSPDNVLVSYNGAVKLIDFGLARAADDGARSDKKTVHGKMRYLAPELTEGRPADERSDLFGLAIVFYELLTAEHPFGLAQGLAAATANARNDPRPARALVPNLASALEEVLDRGLKREPDERYRSADAMRRDIEAFLRAESAYIGDAELGEFVSSVVRGGEDDLVWLRSLAAPSPAAIQGSLRDAGQLGGVGVASGHLAPAGDQGPRSVSRQAVGVASQGSMGRPLAFLMLGVAFAVLSWWLIGAGAVSGDASEPEAQESIPAASSKASQPVETPLSAQPSPEPVEVLEAPPKPQVLVAKPTPVQLPSTQVELPPLSKDTAPPEPPPAPAPAPKPKAPALPAPTPASASPQARAKPLVGASMRGTGRIKVTSNAPSARVTLDGVEVGQVPVSVAAVEGEHSVVVAVEGTTRRASLHVSHGDLKEFHARFDWGKLAIRGVPVGVVCSIDGQTLARAEYTDRWLSVVEGRHVVLCDDPAGTAHSQTIEVRGERRYTYTWPR